MKSERNFYELIEEIYKKDSRYKPDSYEFLMQALKYTQAKLKRQGHVNGKELARGCADFAIEQYGPMAKTVLKHWGITKTEDFGEMVYRMIEKKMLFQTESDSLDDFKGVYHFDAVFDNVLGEAAEGINKKNL